MEPPVRPVQRQSSRFPARKRNKYAGMDGRFRTQCDRDFEHSQHVSSSAHVSSLVAELLRSRGRLERPVSCFSVARCWCNISTSFCCTTVCLSLTMWTDSHTQLNSFSRNFQTSLGIMVSEGKIIIIIIISQSQLSSLSGDWLYT